MSFLLLHKIWGKVATIWERGAGGGLLRGLLLWTACRLRCLQWCALLAPSFFAPPRISMAARAGPPEMLRGTYTYAISALFIFFWFNKTTTISIYFRRDEALAVTPGGGSVSRLEIGRSRAAGAGAARLAASELGPHRFTPRAREICKKMFNQRGVRILRPGENWVVQRELRTGIQLPPGYGIMPVDRTDESAGAAYQGQQQAHNAPHVQAPGKRKTPEPQASAAPPLRPCTPSPRCLDGARRPAPPGRICPRPKRAPPRRRRRRPRTTSTRSKWRLSSGRRSCSRRRTSWCA